MGSLGLTGQVARQRYSVGRSWTYIHMLGDG